MRRFLFDKVNKSSVWLLKSTLSEKSLFPLIIRSVRVVFCQKTAQLVDLIDFYKLATAS